MVPPFGDGPGLYGRLEVPVEVDQTRMRLFEDKFKRLTGDDKTAGELAVLFYLAIVGGYQALSRPSSPAQAKDYLKGIISNYLIHRQVPAPSAT